MTGYKHTAYFAGKRLRIAWLALMWTLAGGLGLSYWFGISPRRSRYRSK